MTNRAERSVLSRRRFLRDAVATTIAFSGLRLLSGCGSTGSAADPLAGFSGFGPLVPDPARVMDLPEGFSYRLLSQFGDVMDDGFVQPMFSDGMYAFAGPGGRSVLVRNHELFSTPVGLGAFGEDNRLLPRADRSRFYDWGFGTPALGGTTTLVYDTRAQRVERQFLSLVGTTRNCAGGPTPWGSWITCEEFVSQNNANLEKAHGYNFEVPSGATGLVEPVALVEMGRFNHEAVAIDPGSGAVYQTEDRQDGLLYRFLPNERTNLAAGGRLQALVVRGRPSFDTRNWSEDRIAVGEQVGVEWVDLDEPESPRDDLRMQGASRGAAIFARGEGMYVGSDGIYFACTSGGRKKVDTMDGTGQIWRYVPSRSEGTPQEAGEPGLLELVFQPNDDTILDKGDNIVVAPWGDLFICEDGDGDRDSLVVLRPDGTHYRFARNAADQSEFAGATFSPDGTTLFVNYQWSGKTFAITGPWPPTR